MIQWEYQNSKIFLARGKFQICISKLVQINFYNEIKCNMLWSYVINAHMIPWSYVIDDINGEGIIGAKDKSGRIQDWKSNKKEWWQTFCQMEWL